MVSDESLLVTCFHMLNQCFASKHLRSVRKREYREVHRPQTDAQVFQFLCYAGNSQRCRLHPQDILTMLLKSMPSFQCLETDSFECISYHISYQTTLWVGGRSSVPLQDELGSEESENVLFLTYWWMTPKQKMVCLVLHSSHASHQRDLDLCV